jgi:hypothetical protein
LILSLILLILTATEPTPRDPAQVRAFRAAHPCPVTGLTTGACPGWVVDHIYPLCAGGKDLPSNMSWQEARQSYIKDNLERDFCRCKKGTP